MYSLVLMMALGTSGEAPAAWGGCGGGCSGYYGSCGGGYGCCGGGYGCHGGRGGRLGHGCRGGRGCNGGYGCCGGGVVYYGCCGGAVAPAAPLQRMPEKVPPPKGEEQAFAAPAPATLIVGLPADAKLTINDALTTSTADRRMFVSPPLDVGKAYAYTLKAEAVRNGQTITVTREVLVRAGQETRVQMDFPVSVARR